MKRKQHAVTCKICGFYSKSYVGFIKHLTGCHKLTSKEYFDTYIEPFEHKCIHCGSSNVKFINCRLGYKTSCGSKACAKKASKKTCLERYGDENYSNREKFKQTIQNNIKNDPNWRKNVTEKFNKTFNKHKNEDPDFLNKIKEKSKKTKKERYGDEYYKNNDKIRQYYLENFGVTWPSQLKTVKEKVKETCKQRYGVEYVMQLKTTKEKRIQTYVKKYGVDNPSKLKSNRDKAKQTTKERYGDENYRNIKKQKQTITNKKLNDKNYIQNIINKRKKTCLEKYGAISPLAKNCGVNSISKLSLRVKNILDKNNIKYTIEYKIQSDEGKNRFYDFKINNNILEINGDYYHANPKRYTEDQYLTIHHIKHKVKDIWNADLIKKQLAESHGFNVIYLWEYDMKKMKDDELYQWLEKNVILYNK